MVDTLTQHGQDLPKHAFTDNAMRDRQLLTEETRSLGETQDELDFCSNSLGAIEGSDSNEPESAAPAGTCTIDPSHHAIVNRVEDMNAKLQATKETVMEQEQKVVSLDVEWDTRKNARGEIVHSEKTALLQIGCRRHDATICAVLFQFHHLKYLPMSHVVA
jgi:hypothetical protein